MESNPPVHNTLIFSRVDDDRSTVFSCAGDKGVEILGSKISFILLVLSSSCLILLSHKWLLFKYKETFYNYIYVKRIFYQW